ncbi:dephospho-CoA kinase [Dictyobacter arantiisoli]|uniref:Dephospho-CoA kinase n=1 Tax=Dictyobacter arantiisoli TaxID=2014874 RepID=A0A5A5THI3_9CHLR|nr:dephospho-CoA kinase [Dictyobacter arantiisoli]GCF10772.1 dephospho-CoA kinase [Dictyobacter arantiisoli]
MPRIIGITGNIACGKSSVGQYLLTLGAERYIDADVLVHGLYAAGQPIALEVGKTFGHGVLEEDGSVKRQALGALVFRDATAMQALEAIVHPAVQQALTAELAQVSEQGIAILDAVKLLQGESAARCQSIWLVVCPIEQQMQRLMRRNNLDEEEARLRLRSQPAYQDKLSLVDLVIQNGGTLQETYRQVQEAFERFCQAFPAVLFKP